VDEGIEVILDGIVYYERYDQWIMTCLTIYAFLAWILVIIATIFNERNRIRLFSKGCILDMSASVLVTFFLLEWSGVRIPYTFVPIYLTRLLLVSIRKEYEVHLHHINLKDLILGSLFTVVVIEILVMTFYHREIISLGLLLNSVWCLKVKRMDFSQKVFWIGSTLILAIFPTIPIIGLAKAPFIL